MPIWTQQNSKTFFPAIPKNMPHTQTDG